MIVLVMDTRGWEGRVVGLLLGLCHVLAHSDELFDKEFEDSILVLGLHLGQFLQLSDLNDVWVLL